MHVTLECFNLAIIHSRLQNFIIHKQKVKETAFNCCVQWSSADDQ